MERERSRETDRERPKSGAKETSIFPDNFCIWEADFVPVVFSDEKRGGGVKMRGTGGCCWVVTSLPRFTGLHRSAHRRSVMQSDSNWCSEEPCEANQGAVQVHVRVLVRMCLCTCIPMKNYTHRGNTRRTFYIKAHYYS